MRPESRIPHLTMWAIAEARRFRLASPSGDSGSDPPAALAAVNGTPDFEPAAPPDSLAFPRPPESVPFPVEWQLEEP